ncbi:hypothetical protein Pmani_010808 [Petrolisthes manimaculis]|uniref:Uncharacterized protein n=1 Tax=Petrolisthes manimaculis TaxID=1843537 RepID=A0AAE1PWN1_9EUCA|nr:hypothetical protein Pmani_023390 [Petrolisthes manimaculis]KAK4314362.1 hypothetical protein Pmani_014346 [Petrolisthes manimaculis]KAK4318166.1 hypothetical protein Pmani_010808 [Petrolisthes manimaculis]
MTVEVMERKLAEFNFYMKSDIVASMTDVASVMMKYGRFSNSEHHLCYAHGLHLAVCDVLYNKKVSSKCHVYGCDSSYTTDERPDTAHEDVTTAEVGVDDCTDSDDGEYDETGGDLTTTLVMENHYDANLRQQIKLEDTSNGYECDISIASIIAKVRTAVKIFRKSPLKNEILQKYVNAEHGY